MPRFVRNVWATITTGNRTVETGPRTGDGGLRATFKLRENGAISDTQIECRFEVIDNRLCVSMREIEDGAYQTPFYTREFQR